MIRDMGKLRSLGVVAVLAVLGTALPAWAQVKEVSAEVPRLGEESNSSAPITWAIIAVASIGILLIAFKNSKRNHMD